MTIKELIEKGKQAAMSSKADGLYGIQLYSGESYRKWLALATHYVEHNYPNDKATERFCEIANRADGNETELFDKMIGILEAFDLLPPSEPQMPITNIITSICKNFNRFEIGIKRRHDRRSTITVTDEYDVQDILGSILRLFVNDVRPEDYVPSYAGGKSRVDFHLPEYGIIIETKMASTSLKDKDIGDQLIIDFQHYKALPHCTHLISFIYDKDGNIVNPHGLISDLEKMSDGDLKMTVIVSP